MIGFTPEELEEMRRADAEIDAEDINDFEQMRESRIRDREIKNAAAPESVRRERERARARYAENRDKNLARERERRRTHREYFAAKGKAYYEANREYILARQKAYDARRRPRRKHRKVDKSYPASGQGELTGNAPVSEGDSL